MSDRKFQIEDLQLYKTLHSLIICVSRYTVNGAAGDKGVENVRRLVYVWSDVGSFCE